VKALIGVLTSFALALLFGGPVGGSAQQPAFVLAVVPAGEERVLARLDAASLDVTGESVSIGRQTIGLGRSAFTWAFTPDVSKLAIGGRLLGGVRFVDLREMRVVGRMTRAFEPLAWLTPRRLLAAEQANLDTGPNTLLVVDPVAGRVVARRALGATIFRTERTTDRLVLLLGTSGRIGRARVAAADARGRVRKVTLGRIQAGCVGDPRTHSVRCKSPGLAVDSVARRAFVVGARLVAVIDVRTMAVRYQDVGAAVADLSLPSSARFARWLGDGLLAVAGSDSTPGDRPTIRPAGLRVIDTQTWTALVIDEGATYFAVANGSVLAFGIGRGIGLRAYALDGRLRFHVLGDEPISWVQAGGGYAYVYRGQEHNVAIVDLDSGTIRESARSLPTLLFPGRPAY
jgi:hypothetical protein